MAETTVRGRIGDKELVLATGKLALLADGAVTASIGGTEVLVTATASRKLREGADFFPLTVDVEERMYAVGRIPGSFFRREGRATEKATLTARLIDRPLRPSFPDGFLYETHVVATILSADLVNDYDVAALNAASAALNEPCSSASWPRVAGCSALYGSISSAFWIVEITASTSP